MKHKKWEILVQTYFIVLLTKQVYANFNIPKYFAFDKGQGIIFSIYLAMTKKNYLIIQ